MQTDNSKLQLTALSDVEYNGQLNRSAGQGAKFALMLSMLHSDILNRPNLIDEHHEKIAPSQDVAAINCYPETPLMASHQHWSEMDKTSELLHEDNQGSRLWGCMHPSPLSQFNDPLRIDEQVLANCPLHTQKQFQSKKVEKEVDDVIVDETGLYDILEQLNPQFQEAS